MKAEKQYFIANILFLLIFLGVVLFLLLFREHLVCPYKANGLPCPTCGLSRTIVSLLGQEHAFKPSASMLFLASFFLGQIVIRTLLLVAALFKVRFSGIWIISDGLVSACWFAMVIVPFYW